MNQITRLVEQHVRESELHLRHIDDLMAREPRAGELEDIRRQPAYAAPVVVERREGLKGVLQTMGLELEKALTAIFEHHAH